MFGFRRTILFVAAAFLILAAAVSAPDVLRVGAFSSQDASQILPDEWERLTLGEVDRQTEYNLVAVDSTVVVHAKSDGGASGLITRRRIDPNEYPILKWRWRVENVLDDGNARTKDGDDFAARLYVTFDYDLGLGGRIKRTALQALGYDDIPTRALNYVWANRVPIDTVFPNAYTDWVMMMPLESGEARTGEWVVERRNIVADYRKAFGEDPPAITGVAIMTDTDNTGGTATAYYGDIIFQSREQEATSDLDASRD